MLKPKRRDIFLMNLPQGYRAVDSIFDDMAYVINDIQKTVTIYTVHNGNLTVPFEVIQDFVSELQDTYKIQCTNGCVVD